MGIKDITPNKFFEYIRLDTIDSSPETYTMFFVMMCIIGLVILTLRYSLNPRTKEEYNLWKNETFTTKIILCLITGFASYLMTFLITGILDAISLVTIGEKGLDLKFFDISTIVLSMIVGFGLLYLLANRMNLYGFKDVQYFITITIFAAVPLASIGLFIVFLPKDLSIAFFFLLPLLLILGIVSPLILKYIQDKKHQELNKKQRKELNQLLDDLKIN